MDDVDEFFGGLGSRVVAGKRGIDEMFPNMILDHFRNEAVEGSAARRRLLQDTRAFLLFLDRALDGLDLAPDPLQPIEELGFLASDVRHL